MGKIILIGNYPPPFSGQSIAFKTLVDGFVESNREYYILNTSEKDGERGTINRAIDYVKVFLKLLILLFDKKVSIIYHIISSSKKGFIRDFVIINLTNLFGKKIILHSHNGNYNSFYNNNTARWKNVIERTISKACKIILLSSKLRSTFSFIKDNDKFVFISNGLPIDLPAKINKTYDKIDVLYLSNLIESKGYLDVLDAIVYLKKNNQHKNFNFHFAGAFMLNPTQDKSYDSIEQAKEIFFEIIEKHELSEIITYHGIVMGEKKSELLEKANVFLLPSYYDVEAQPITIIEAMAFGCAVYASNYRAIPEMLKNNSNGEFVESENPIDIVKKLLDLNNEKLEKYSIKSKDIYSQKFTKEKHIDNMFSLFNKF